MALDLRCSDAALLTADVGHGSETEERADLVGLSIVASPVSAAAAARSSEDEQSERMKNAITDQSLNTSSSDAPCGAAASGLLAVTTMSDDLHTREAASAETDVVLNVTEPQGTSGSVAEATDVAAIDGESENKEAANVDNIDVLPVKDRNRSGAAGCLSAQSAVGGHVPLLRAARSFAASPAGTSGLVLRKVNLSTRSPLLRSESIDSETDSEGNSIVLPTVLKQACQMPFTATDAADEVCITFRYPLALLSAGREELTRSSREGYE